MANDILFQVIKDGKVFFWTTHPECVPNEDEIKAMKKAGYKIKMKETGKSNKEV